MKRGVCAGEVLGSLVVMMAAIGCKSDRASVGNLLASQVIGSAGGEIAASGVRLSIPAHAVATDTTFELRASDASLSGGVYNQRGQALAWFPTGLSLRLPAHLHLDDDADTTVLFMQDGMTVAGQGADAYINELGPFAIANAAESPVVALTPMLARAPADAGAAMRERVRLEFMVGDASRLDLALTLYDSAQAYDKPLNGNGLGDCGIQLENVAGASLRFGCVEGPLTARLTVTNAQVGFDVTPFLAGRLEVPVTVGVVAGDDDMAYQLGFFAYETGPCFAQACSGRGRCEERDGTATCMCDPGFAADGLSCACAPQCDNRTCGSDGCGGQCGAGCGAMSQCQDGRCVPNQDDGGGSSTGSASDSASATTTGGGDDASTGSTTTTGASSTGDLTTTGSTSL